MTETEILQLCVSPSFVWLAGNHANFFKYVRLAIVPFCFRHFLPADTSTHISICRQLCLCALRRVICLSVCITAVCLCVSGVRLNKPYQVRVPMDIPVFTGNHGDLLVLVRKLYTCHAFSARHTSTGANYTQMCSVRSFNFPLLCIHLHNYIALKIRG